MHVRAIDVHIELQFLPDGLDVLQTLLIIGTSSTDPDLNIVLYKNRSKFTESTDDTLESGRNL